MYIQLDVNYCRQTESERMIINSLSSMSRPAFYLNG